jgi:hypothetical protein
MPGEPAGKCATAFCRNLSGDTETRLANPRKALTKEPSWHHRLIVLGSRRCALRLHFKRMTIS